MSSRGLSLKFMEALKSGVLKPILCQVKKDRTLDLQIRDNYINVYYRGGSLIKVEEKDGGYSGEFNTAYMKAVLAKNNTPRFPYIIKRDTDASTLVHELFPFMKTGMDQTFSDKETSEREFQQLVVRENNYSPVSNDTDYTICDIEYTHTKYKYLRFDLLATHWPSKSPIRKKQASMKLVLVEMKYGDGALRGAAGIKKHYEDMKKAIGHIGTLCTEMTTVTKQKAELGLIQKSKLDSNETGRIERIKVSANEKPEWILLLANHKPDSSILRDELNWLKNISEMENFPFDIKIAVSNFMGYGLYENHIFSLSEFLENFLSQKSDK